MTLSRLRGPTALTAGASLVAVLAAAAPADAHHSFGMFAQDQAVTLTGTVKSYAFAMPHVWFFMVAPVASGSTEEWGLEMGSPNLAVRKGWNINTLKPGDKVTVVMHPMKDGSKAGSVMNVTLADGRTLQN
jgi:hypothetical protein